MEYLVDALQVMQHYKPYNSDFNKTNKQNMYI